MIDPARAPYWTLPDVGDASLAFTAPRYQSVSVRSCAGDTFPLVGKAVLARLGSGARWYVMPQLADVQAGAFIADNCADAAHYPLSPDVLVGNPLRFRHHSGDPCVDRLPRDRCPVSARLEGLGRVRDVRQLRLRPGWLRAHHQHATKTPVTGNFYARLQYSSSDTQRPVRRRQHADPDVLAMSDRSRRTLALAVFAGSAVASVPRRARTTCGTSTRDASSGSPRARPICTRAGTRRAAPATRFTRVGGRRSTSPSASSCGRG